MNENQGLMLKVKQIVSQCTRLFTYSDMGKPYMQSRFLVV